MNPFAFARSPGHRRSLVREPNAERRGSAPAGRALDVGLPDEAATAHLGYALAQALRQGDLLTLTGPLGAGKSFLARALIRAALDDANADVPSPSYTLANVYQRVQGPIWHTDLYRLAGPDEIEEIGLLDALAEAVVIVEWPDRLGRLLPLRHLAIVLDVDPGSDHGIPDGTVLEDRALRRAWITANGPGWDDTLDRIRAEFGAENGSKRLGGPE